MEILRPRGLFEYLGILWRKKLLIILVATSVLIATQQIIRHIPSVYESHALIVISNQGNGNDDRLPSSPPLTALTQRMTSQGNLTEIVRRYDLYRQPPGVVSDPGVAVERLRKAIKIEVKMRNYYPDAPESLTVSYRYTDPAVAQRVVADLISIFDNTNATIRRQAAAELERFQSQVVDIETQLQGLAPQRDMALLRSGSLNNNPSVVRAQRLAAADSIGSLGDREFMLARQIDEQKRQIAEQEKLVSSAPPASRLASNNAYGILLARRAEVEGQIKDLARTATEKNPKMIQAKSQLASINQEITRLEAASGASSGAAGNSASPEALELRTMRRELQRLETELEVTRRDLSRKAEGLKELPKEQSNADKETASTIRLNEAKAEYDRLMGRYNWLMDKQESLRKLSGDDGRSGETFQVIDAPIARTAPVGPNRLMLKLIGAGIALALGLLIASAREIPRLFLIHNDRDVEYYLGTPVLAMIPETLTPAQRGRRRVLWGLRWVGLALLLGAMIPALVIVLDRAQVFQILASR
ncbi:MAG TPA: Wzz/FepE/Etk N-terminal domain-containing protein [Blastocatellia bacterium]|nr:Wzz/FepE/Etk N-terminal domain-containing protein [Blastocatellia bacterium]